MIDGVIRRTLFQRVFRVIRRAVVVRGVIQAVSGAVVGVGIPDAFAVRAFHQPPQAVIRVIGRQFVRFAPGVARLDADALPGVIVCVFETAVQLFALIRDLQNAVDLIVLHPGKGLVRIRDLRRHPHAVAAIGNDALFRVGQRLQPVVLVIGVIRCASVGIGQARPIPDMVIRHGKLAA